MTIDEQSSVCVAIESHAEIGMLSSNFPLCDFQMQRAAIAVDVAAVWFIVNCDDVSAQTPEELRRPLVRGPVGAINNDGETGQRKIMGHIVDQVVEISRSQLGSILLIGRVALLAIVGLGIRNGGLVADVLLNEPFRPVVQLAP